MMVMRMQILLTGVSIQCTSFVTIISFGNDKMLIHKGYL